MPGVAALSAALAAAPDEVTFALFADTADALILRFAFFPPAISSIERPVVTLNESPSRNSLLAPRLASSSSSLISSQFSFFPSPRMRMRFQRPF